MHFVPATNPLGPDHGELMTMTSSKASSGTIDELWRYPVKSMGGERLEVAHLAHSGLGGDRLYAIRDEENGEILSAKRLPKLLQFTACHSAVDGTISVTTPADRVIALNAPLALALLGAELGRVVSIQPLLQDDGHYRRRFPLNPEGVKRLLGLPPTEELPAAPVPNEVRSVLRNCVTWPGTHFDVAPLHIITRQSLRQLAQGSEDAARPERYRANIVLEMDEDSAWPEEQWQGWQLHIGEVVVAITNGTVRCAMPRYAQRHLAANATISTLLRDRTQHVLGVYARVLRGGELRAGMPFRLEKDSGPRSYYSLPSYANPHAPPTQRGALGDRLFRVTHIREESPDTTSIEMVPEQGPLLPFLPGQHVILQIPDLPQMSRPYSLSSGIDEPVYRISVRHRQGENTRFTRRLVRAAAAGNQLRVRGPRGSFFVDPDDDTPLILASAGIGITPFLSMLRSCATSRPMRGIHLFHCTPDSGPFAFEGDLRTTLQALPQLNIDIHSKGPRGDEPRLRFHQSRLDGQTLLRSPLIGGSARIMICGTP